MPSERAGSYTRAYIGIGGNMLDPRSLVNAGLESLGGIPQTRLLKCSSLYRTAPLGPPGQADYINAAAALETALPPLSLLDALQAIEQTHGRRRDGPRWGPRTLDLDLLLYGGQDINVARLRVPHPEMHRRAFVLIPLSEIAPKTLLIPGIGRLQHVLAACDQSGVQRFEP